MPRLPTPFGSLESLLSTLTQWKAIIDTHLPNDANPLNTPRNARTSQPAANTIRLRWDPGGLAGDGWDVQYGEKADFKSSQSHRIYSRENRYFDLVVGDENKRFFRVRAFRASKFSSWSNTVAGTAFLNAVVSGNPGTVNFTPTLAAYSEIAFKEFSLTGKGDSIHIDIWVVDEPRIRFLSTTLAQDIDGTTDPLVGVTLAVRRKPTNFDAPVGEDPTYELLSVGDYLVFDDPSQDADVAEHATWRRYEVCRVKTVTGNQDAGQGDTFNLTVDLEARGSLGSRKQAHVSGIPLYKLKRRHYTLATKDNAGNDRILNEETFPIGNATVVAMEIAVSDLGTLGSYKTVNCSPLAYPFPGAFKTLNPAPGFRTCQGAEYFVHLDRLLVAGQSLPAWHWIGEDAGIRNAIATVQIAPIGNTAVYNGVLYSFTNVAIVIYFLLIEQFRRGGSQGSRRVAVLEQVGIRENEFNSFVPTDIPDFRRMPYGAKYPIIRCPIVGSVESLYDLSLGQLRINAVPLTATGEYLDFQEACQLDMVVALIGTQYAGSSAVGVLLT